MAVTAKPEISKILLDLGIDPIDVYAVDNAEKTYMSALIEGINTLEFANKGDSPRSIILREELKGVREKRRGPKAITKKVSINKLMGRKTSSMPRIEPQKLLSAGEDEETKKEVRTRKDPLITISNSLTSIINILKEHNKFLKDTANKDRKDDESDARKKRESDLETPLKGMSVIATKITKPFQGILS